MLKLMNALFRSKVARFLFRWLVHPDIAAYLGKMFSGKSRKSHGNRELPISVLDFLAEYTQKHHALHGDVEAYIFGHLHILHRSVVYGFEVFFLSDWSRAEATYAAMERIGIELMNFKIEDTIS